MSIVPVRNWVQHRSLQGLPLWMVNMHFRPPCRLQCPPQPRPLSGPVEAGQQKCSYMLGNKSAVFRAELTKLGADVRYAVIILHSNLYVLPKKYSRPKLPAFKTRHGPRGLQAACKQMKRHVTCNNMARVRALLQFFSRTARHNPQMWLLPVPNWVPHRSSTRFATLGGSHAWQTPVSATVPPTAPPPLSGPVQSGTKTAGGPEGTVRYAGQ